MQVWDQSSFHDSLQSLAQLALKQTGAVGYRFVGIGPAPEEFRQLAPGTFPVDEAPVIIEYPLQEGTVTAAMIAFSFGTKENAESARPRLDRFMMTIQTVWREEALNEYGDLVRRVADLEARLIDSKISDRARGLLALQTSADSADSIARHVDGVLRSRGTTRSLLENLVSELEQELDARKQITEAKQILQAQGLSEEQAHAQLRLTSRKSRKRLKQIALELIQRQEVSKERTA